MALRITLAHQFKQQQGETFNLAFSLDGKQLVSSDGNALYLWQLSGEGTWSYERSLPFRNAVFPLFASRGEMLAYLCEAELIKLISLEGKERAIFPRPSHTFWAFSPDLHWLVSSDRERNILLWDLISGQGSPIIIPCPIDDKSGKSSELSNEFVGRFLFTPDSQRVVLFADSSEGSLHICAFEPEHRRITLQKTLPEGMIDGVISPNGKMLAIIVPNGQIYSHKEEVYVYDLDSLQLHHVFPQTTDKRYCLLAFSPDSRFLMSCKSDGWVDIFSLSSLECVAQFAAHPGLSSHATDPIGGLDWSSTGYIATGGASVFEKDMKRTDYTIKIWRVEEE